MILYFKGKPQIASVMASIKYERVFKHFKTLHLRKNMRADSDQLKFCNWLGDIGAGKNYEKGSNEVRIPDENLAKSEDELLDFCFKDLFKDPLSKSDSIADAAILAPRNENVDNINKKALSRMKGNKETLESIDTPLRPDISDPMSIYRVDKDIEVIHNSTPPGLPPHILELKVL